LSVTSVAVSAKRFGVITSAVKKSGHSCECPFY
jgi:hypothetical protein